MVAHYNKQGFRGRWLEDRIVQTNNMYRHRNIALVTKVPTPTAVTRKGGQLVGAKYTEKSIVDFVGIYHTGQFIAFDTKECQQSSFPFKNVKKHQEDYLTDVRRLNGIAFILIFFRNFNELYLIYIDEYMKLKESLGRKSIPYQWFRDNKEIIKTQNGYYFDYLNAKGTNI